MSKSVKKIIKSLERAEKGLLDELERVRTALLILDPSREDVVAPVIEPPKERKVIQLPAVHRERALRVKEAAIDDVLALVATGVSSIKELEKHLPYAMRTSIYRRLHELQREGVVRNVNAHHQRLPGEWVIVDQTAHLNWVENRARELANDKG